MLAIGRRRSNFSLTKSGRTKSCAVNCVSRTRFRRAGERRKRRGRCTNFLTGQGYPFGGRVASSPQEESGRVVDLTGRRVPCSACFGRLVSILMTRSARTRTTDYLLVDISNSYTKFAFASTTRISSPVRIATDKLLNRLFARFLTRQKVRRVVVSSVVPGKNSAVSSAAGKIGVLWLNSILNLGVGLIIPSRNQSEQTGWRMLRQLQRSMAVLPSSWILVPR